MVWLVLPICESISDVICRQWYTNQSMTASGPDAFFTDPTAIQYYLDNARTIMNRMNTVTKLAYNNDPTIMAWDLINEGRCDANCTAADLQVRLSTPGLHGVHSSSTCACAHGTSGYRIISLGLWALEVCLFLYMYKHA